MGFIPISISESIIRNFSVQFFDQERIVAASSTGSVTIFLYHPNNQVKKFNLKNEFVSFF